MKLQGINEGNCMFHNLVFPGGGWSLQRKSQWIRIVWKGGIAIGRLSIEAVRGNFGRPTSSDLFCSGRQTTFMSEIEWCCSILTFKCQGCFRIKACRLVIFEFAVPRLKHHFFSYHTGDIVGVILTVLPNISFKIQPWANAISPDFFDWGGN